MTNGDVERFNYVGNDAEMVAESDGEFVRYSDYEALESRLAQVEKEREFWNRLKTATGKLSSNAAAELAEILETLP